MFCVLKLRCILESYGYVMKRPSGGSSHCTFCRQGRPPITTTPHNEPIKKIYVIMVKEIIESEASDDENT